MNSKELIKVNRLIGFSIGILKGIKMQDIESDEVNKILDESIAELEEGLKEINECS